MPASYEHSNFKKISILCEEYCPHLAKTFTYVNKVL